MRGRAFNGLSYLGLELKLAPCCFMPSAREDPWQKPESLISIHQQLLTRLDSQGRPLIPP